MNNVSQITTLNNVAKFSWTIKGFTCCAGAGWLTSNKFHSECDEDLEWFLELKVERSHAVLHVSLRADGAFRDAVPIEVVSILSLKDFSFTVNKTDQVRGGDPLELTFSWEERKWTEWIFEDAVIKCAIFRRASMEGSIHN